MEKLEALHRYWFDKVLEDPNTLSSRSALWFGKDAKLDEEVRTRFSPLLEKDSLERLESQLQTPVQWIGFILLTDQVPRNSFRDTPRAFAYDSYALRTAKRVVSEPWFGIRNALEQMFGLLPFEHSEILADQVASLEHFKKLVAQAPSSLASYLEEVEAYARRHLEIIERFGRFPHRNRILGRPSTPDEVAFLKTPRSSF